MAPNQPPTSAPQPPPPPPTGQPSTVVMVHGDGGPATAVMSPFPVRMVCPHCGMDIITNTHAQTGLMTCILCLVLWECGLCCIPFCCDSTKDIIHSCPLCGAVIACDKRC